MSDQRESVFGRSVQCFPPLNKSIRHEGETYHKTLRLIDESGEDYLYSEKSFAPIKLPQIAEDAFMALA